jgi:hypothetical protein
MLPLWADAEQWFNKPVKQLTNTEPNTHYMHHQFCFSIWDTHYWSLNRFKDSFAITLWTASMYHDIPIVSVK